MRDGNLYARGATDDKGPVLVALYGFTMAAIGELEEVPIGTVKSRINRGRIELAKVLRRMKVNPD